MKEISDILNAYDRARAAGADLALATVVRVEGSSYRKPGARMLILADGATVGGISGGCIERDAILRAGAVMTSGTPALVRYETTPDEDGGPGYSLGCGGAIDVLIETLPSNQEPPAIRFLRTLWTVRKRGRIATVIAARGGSALVGNRLLVDETGYSEGGLGNDHLTHLVLNQARASISPSPGTQRSLTIRYPLPDGWADVFLEIIPRRQDLFIFGAGADARPLIAQAKGLGWRVTVIDLRSSPAGTSHLDADETIRCHADEIGRRLQIGSDAVAVLMTHNFGHDLAVLRALGQNPVRYLGVLGPRHRTHRLSEAVATDSQVNTLYAPIGLDIGAATPEEIALAIVAEITAVLRHRPGGSLRDRPGPIHAAEEPDPIFTPRAPCPIAAS